MKEIIFRLWLIDMCYYFSQKKCVSILMPLKYTQWNWTSCKDRNQLDISGVRSLENFRFHTIQLISFPFSIPHSTFSTFWVIPNFHSHRYTLHTLSLILFWLYQGKQTLICLYLMLSEICPYLSFPKNHNSNFFTLAFDTTQSP